jgi:hypothetical protein
MREGAGADRQLMVWEHTHDFQAVVVHIVSETYEGLDILPGKLANNGTFLENHANQRSAQFACDEFPSNSLHFQSCLIALISIQ